MNPRQKAAYSFLNVDNASILDDANKEYDDVRQQAAKGTKKKANLVGTGIGALIGAYFGNPQLGAMVGGQGGEMVGGLLSGEGISAPSSEAALAMADGALSSGTPDAVNKVAPVSNTDYLNSNMPPVAQPSGNYETDSSKQILDLVRAAILAQRK